jgi:hypothetical protein
MLLDVVVVEGELVVLLPANEGEVGEGVGETMRQLVEDKDPPDSTAAKKEENMSPISKMLMVIHKTATC